MLGETSSTELVWSGIEYDSIEHCQVSYDHEGIDINSTILGHYQDNIYFVQYKIRTDETWTTRKVQVNSKINGVEQSTRLETEGNGTWIINGKEDATFQDCFDVDLPLSPFTNTLPINRLRMQEHDMRQIKVIYIDLLKQMITPVFQKYIRLTDAEYRYENVPNDFEAVIRVDANGFVINYPTLFKRVTSK